MAGTGPATLAPMREWRLHLGAHKTATTHLQHLLQALRPDLVAAGIDPLPMEAVRPLATRHLRRRNWRVWVGGRPMMREIDAAIAPLRRGPGTVILSEENLLGSPHSALATKPYPDLDWRLGALASLRRQCRVDVFLAIRSMETFLPSVYSQGLRHTPPPEVLATAKPRLLAAPPRWTDLIARIEKAMPGVAIHVWRYEDYREHARAIATHLLGHDPGPLPDIAPPARTMTPSAEAVAEAEGLDRDLPPGDWHERAKAIYTASPTGSPGTTRFAPFGPAERERFAAIYAEDCAEIAATGRLLQFAAPT